jgi:hypothetical protein
VAVVSIYSVLYSAYRMPLLFPCLGKGNSPYKPFSRHGNKSADVTTATGPCSGNNKPLLYKHPRKGKNTWSGQFNDALVGSKKDFINKF